MTTTELFSLRGKRALVTGGSRGVGLEIARGLLAAGAEVMISSRKHDAVADAAESLGCDGFAADVSSREGCVALAGRLGADPLHVLVNNAGATWGAPIDDFPEAGWDKVLNVNVKGVFYLSQALLPQLRLAAVPGDPSRIINIGSGDGVRVPDMDNYSYSASKAAVHMLTRHLAKRLARENITVNAIAPGPFHSQMTAFLLDDPSGRSEVEGLVPLGRIGVADDLAGTSTFLASRAAAYITGAVIPLDGGITGCG